MPTIEELQVQINALQQQMAALTTPPDTYYTSIWSGEEIDAAIQQVKSGLVGGVASFNGRTGVVVPQTGDYNATQIPVSAGDGAESVAAALNNKAPAGYGLGLDRGATIQDLNNALNNGWYYFGSGCLNCPVSLPYYEYGAVLVISRGAVKTQLYFQAVDKSCCAIRVFDNNGWQPWECVNPPMQLGVEYRTPERYNDKPVYMKLINIGAATNGKSVSIGSNYLIEAQVIMKFSNYTLPSPALPFGASADSLPNTNGSGFYTNTNTIILVCGSSLPEATAYARVKYTKESP